MVKILSEWLVMTICVMRGVDDFGVCRRVYAWGIERV